jgi:NADH-quinone oxidoreductase subunit M
MQFVEQRAWIPGAGIGYHLGVDGISLLLVLLTTLLTPLCVLSAWSQITTRVKEFLVALCLLETGMVGVFVALDLFLFFVFWEAMLIPMYLIVGVWGGPRRVYAAVKFILYTMAGSTLMLLAILALYFLQDASTRSFDYAAILSLSIDPRLQFWLFLAFALAFAVKVPMFPFHTWLPDAHVEAPTAGSVILAGVLLKMGTYGFARFGLPLFPEAAVSLAPVIAGLAIVGILYGAWVSTVQPDLKKLVAYSSVSHLGFVMLGLFTFTAQGLVGGVLQMVNHGLSTGALFLLVGMIYERRHSRLIADFGGLWAVMPVFSVLFLVVTLSSIGLPGLNGFVGEILILVGAFQWSRPAAVLGTLGIIFAAVYMLWMYQRVAFGEVRHPENRRLPDLNGRELWTLVPLLILIVWIGVYPKPFTAITEPAVAKLLQTVQDKRAPARVAGLAGSPASR